MIGLTEKQEAKPTAMDAKTRGAMAKNGQIRRGGELMVTQTVEQSTTLELEARLGASLILPLLVVNQSAGLNDWDLAHLGRLD